jgi:hypothetical protein
MYAELYQTQQGNWRADVHRYAGGFVWVETFDTRDEAQTALADFGITDIAEF